MPFNSTPPLYRNTDKARAIRLMVRKAKQSQPKIRPVMRPKMKVTNRSNNPGLDWVQNQLNQNSNTVGSPAFTFGEDFDLLGINKALENVFNRDNLIVLLAGVFALILVYVSLMGLYNNYTTGSLDYGTGKYTPAKPLSKVGRKRK